MKTILSLIFLFILIFCTWSGFKNGLIMGIFSVVAFIVSVYGANLLSNTYSGEVVDALRPFASGFMEVNVIDETVRPAMGIDATGLSVSDYLAQNPDRQEEFCIRTYEGMGLFETTCSQLAGEAVAYAAENAVPLIDAAVEIVCLRIAYAGGFLLSFAMLLILLTVIGNLPNLSFKIPNFDALNDISGAVLGLTQGVCLCLVFGWALKFTGIIFPQETLSNTFLVSWFMDRSILVHALGV